MGDLASGQNLHHGCFGQWGTWEILIFTRPVDTKTHLVIFGQRRAEFLHVIGDSASGQKAHLSFFGQWT